MYNCNICNKRIHLCSTYIQCQSCNINHAHLHCINRSHHNYNSWSCSCCPSSPNLPFNHILHNDDFFAALTSFFSDTKTNIANLNSLCFNPLLTDPISDQTCDHPSLLTHSKASTHDCNYHTDESFNKIKLLNDSNAFTMLHFNCRSISKSHEHISTFLHQLKHPFSLIACSETWLTHNKSPPNCDNYTYIEGPLTGRGRGVCMYLRSDLKYNPTDFTLGPEADSLFIEITLKHNSTTKNIIVGVVYKLHEHTINNFNSSWETLLNKLSSTKKDVYILGDFNINLLKHDTNPHINDFINTSLAHSFIPKVDKPTRITHNTATIIDNIITNSTDIHSATGILVTDISDHFPIFHITSHQNSQHTIPFTQKRDFCEHNISIFNNKLQEETWESTLNSSDPDIAYNNFINMYTKHYNTSFPLKRSSPRKRAYTRKQPWITNGIIRSIKHKQKLYQINLRKKTQQAGERYKKYRNKLTHIIRLAKKAYNTDQLLKLKHDLTRTWKFLNNIIGRKRKINTFPDHFIHNGTTLTDPKDITNTFNDYFTNLGSNLANKIPAPNKPFTSHLSNSPLNSLFFNPITLQELHDLRHLLKSGKSMGTDNIDPGIANKSYDHITTPLLHIFNQSLLTGIVPHKLKSAKVIPVFKSKDQHHITNYRPISVLPPFSKILEKIIHTRLYNFLDNSDTLVNEQYGFRSKRSTYMALLELTTNLTHALKKKDHTMGIFLDLSKAFDTIDHNILLDKLNHYGIRGIALDWFKSYLTHRTQSVHALNCHSTTRDVTVGVPQGSILGPLLFIIYMNDITNTTSILKLILYADDTNIFLSHSDLESLYHNMNTELTHITDWFRANKLSLNVSKTNFMLFSPKTPHHSNKITIDNQNISQVHTTKFLGITIDDKLTWNHHINSITTRASHAIGTIYRVKHHLPHHTLKSLYNTLVLPHISYCNIIWASNYQSRLTSLNITQKWAIRTITNSRRWAHTLPLFHNLKTLKITDINHLQTALFMHDYFYNNLPANFANYFTTNRQIHAHYTRQAHKFHLPLPKTTAEKHRILYHGAKLWNDLPNTLTDITNKQSFKRQLKQHYISSYATP